MNRRKEEHRGASDTALQSVSDAPPRAAAKQGEGNAAMPDRVGRMGTASIPKLAVEFAIPAILGMVVNGAYNLIDSVFLGHGAGEIGLSAITVASPTMTIFLALAMLIGAGGNALCALRLGEGKHDEAEHILGNTAMLAVVASVILAVLAHIPFVVEPLLTLSSATDTVRPYARDFIQIVSLGCVFQIVGMGLNNFIRTAGAPNRALVTMLIGAVGCTIFNAIFVLWWGWGVAGSAWATICGQAISCATVIWYFTKTPGVPLRLRRRYFGLKAKLVRGILSLGAASFAVQAAGAIVNFFINFMLVKYGSLDPIGADDALASVGVVQRIGMFVILPLIGVSIAIQPLLGFNYGAKLWDRVKTTLKVGSVGATVMGTLMWVAIMLFAPQIVGFFGIKEQSLVDFTAFALRVDLIFLPLIGFQIVGANYFQATGQPVKSIILSLTRQILFLVPLLFILPETLPSIAPMLDSLDAVYFAVPLADFLAVFTVVVFVVVEMRVLNRRSAEAKAGKDAAHA